MFEQIIAEANDAVIVAEINPDVGPGFRIVYANKAFTHIFGYLHEEVVGKSPRMLQGKGTCAETIREISSVVHAGKSIRRRILNYTRAGQPIWVDVNIVPLSLPNDHIQRFAAVERDVTNDVERERQLEALAFADPLTKLANRRYFEQTLERELTRSRRQGLPLSLAILDIDRFKFVNDTWGHPIGDRVLIAVARSILHSVRNYDFVARFGGEEFTVLLPGASLADSKQVTERICADVRAHAHVIVDTQTIMVTCSAGVTALAETDDQETILSRADRALYIAKSEGRNRVAWLDVGAREGDSRPGRSVCHVA
jgi:diguanylate cyclase (GGDEF)-like protein/PAS domain S-box-containing protein